MWCSNNQSILFWLWYITDVNSYEVPNNQINILEKNMNDLTEGQRLKIKIVSAYYVIS